MIEAEAVALLEASLIDCRNPFFLLLFFIIDDIKWYERLDFSYRDIRFSPVLPTV
jgi:hypothetical protein